MKIKKLFKLLLIISISVLLAITVSAETFAESSKPPEYDALAGVIIGVIAAGTIAAGISLRKVHITNRQNMPLMLIMICLIMFFAITSPIIEILGSNGYMDNRLNSKNLIVTESYADENTPFASVINTVEEIKTGIKNIYSNCIPFYSLIVDTVKSAELKMLSVSDSFINAHLLYDDSSAESTDSTQDQPGAMEREEKKRYSTSRIAPNVYKIDALNIIESIETAQEAELNQMLDKQLDYLDRLYQRYPELNYYLYMGTRLQDTELYAEMIQSPASTYAYFQRFTQELNPAYQFDYLRIDSLEDRMKKIYRTDHHWTAYGAYEGYQQIINMMNDVVPEVGDPVEYNIVKIDGIKWLGSLSSGIRDEAYMDDFYVFDNNALPKGINGRIAMKMQFESWRKGNYPTGDVTYDYYGSYFNPQNQYTCNNNTGHNLLIIGDSYAWSIAPLIAAHYDNTYCYLKPFMEDHMERDYKAIIEENDITDVLVLLYSSRLLFGIASTDFDNFLD